jgi:hypothetical protein
MDSAHKFVRAHVPHGGLPDPSDPRYDRIRADPPAGCEVTNCEGWFALQCQRPGLTLLDAIANTVAEIHRDYGLTFDDAGITKPFEWFEDGKNGLGARIIAQLLLMAHSRASALGYSADDMKRFIDTLP